MNARDIMTADPACCRPDTPIVEVARLMCHNDCGVIPVVDSNQKLQGVVTDRDIVCRAVLQGCDIAATTAAECMSDMPVSVRPGTSVEECCQVLEEHQIRRLMVVDESGRCCGIISQADIARNASEHQAAEVLREVSKEGQHHMTRPPLAHA
jgi:CBS domain-containing protein